MSIWTIVTNIFKPISEIIESFNLSSVEKEKYRAAMAQMQADLAAKMIYLQEKELKYKSKIILAESTGKSWLQRNWRPITMMTFLVLVVADQLGYLAYPLSTQAWVLMKIGIGGYIAGRSAEKVMPAVVQAMEKHKHG